MAFQLSHWIIKKIFLLLLLQRLDLSKSLHEFKLSRHIVILILLFLRNDRQCCISTASITANRIFSYISYAKNHKLPFPRKKSFNFPNKYVHLRTFESNFFLNFGSKDTSMRYWTILTTYLVNFSNHVFSHSNYNQITNSYAILDLSKPIYTVCIYDLVLTCYFWA